MYISQLGLLCLDKSNQLEPRPKFLALYILAHRILRPSQQLRTRKTEGVSLLATMIHVPYRKGSGIIKGFLY